MSATRSRDGELDPTIELSQRQNLNDNVDILPPETARGYAVGLLHEDGRKEFLNSFGALREKPDGYLTKDDAQARLSRHEKRHEGLQIVSIKAKAPTASARTNPEALPCTTQDQAPEKLSGAHRLHLGRSTGPETDTTVKPWSPTFEELVAVLSKPKVGAKSGSYFTLGTFENNVRGNENMKALSALCIDGDKHIDAETGEILPFCVSPKAVHEALKDKGLQHIVFTTHSNREGAPKFRVIVPGPMSIDALTPMIDHVIQILWDAGLMVVNVAEHRNPSQPWYFPRIEEQGSAFEIYSHAEGKPFDAEEIERICRAWREENRSTLPSQRNSELSTDTPIGRFLEANNSAEYILTLLTSHGFELKRSMTINDHQAYRLIPPDSTSGQPGVRVYLAKDRKKWLVVSSNDSFPIDGCVDAFELFVMLEHGGDQSLAVKAISEDGAITADAFGDGADDEEGLIPLSEEEERTPFPKPFPGVMADAVERCLKSAHKPQPDITTLSVLVAMASAIDGRFRTNNGTRFNLYGLGIVESTMGKESPKNYASQFSSIAGGTVIGKPASGQGLEDSLTDETGMLICLDEVGHFLKSVHSDRAASYQIEIAEGLLKLFSASGGHYFTRVRAQGKAIAPPRTLKNPCLSFLGFTTPSALADGLNTASIEQGLLGRFLFAVGDNNARQRMATEPVALDEQTLQRFRACSAGFHDDSDRDPYLVKVCDWDGAESYLGELLERFNDEGQEAPTPEARTMIRRSFEKVVRISGVLAIWDDTESPLITIEHIQWAEELVRASNANLLRFAEDRIHESHVLADLARIKSVMKKILRHEIKLHRTFEIEIRNQGKGRVARTALLKSSKMDKKRFDEALRQGIDQGDIAEGRFTQKGKKPIAYVYFPKW